MVLLAISGLALGLSLGAVLRLPIPKVQQALAGLFLAGFIWVGILKAQSSFNEHALMKTAGIDGFAEVSGHCGVDLSLSLKRQFGADESIEHQVEEFFRRVDCRNSHYLLLEKKNRIECGAGEKPVECRTRWMSVFAERGIWTLSSRKMFFDRVMELWNLNKDEETLVGYLLKDQELELGRQALSKQIGIERSSKTAMLLELRDEIDNIKLTEKIFATVAPFMEAAQDKTAPYMIKYKDAASDAKQKIARISDYEKQLKKIQEEQ